MKLNSFGGLRWEDQARVTQTLGGNHIQAHVPEGFYDPYKSGDLSCGLIRDGHYNVSPSRHGVQNDHEIKPSEVATWPELHDELEES